MQILCESVCMCVCELSHNYYIINLVRLTAGLEGDAVIVAGSFSLKKKIILLSVHVSIIVGKQFNIISKQALIHIIHVHEEQTEQVYE